LDTQIYVNMMSGSPVISEDYLYSILHLPDSCVIDQIKVSQVVESNTALVIRFSVRIKKSGQDDETQKYFIKTIKSSTKPNVYHDLSIKEAEFYQLFSSHSMEGLPIVRCLDSYISDDRSGYLILLQDISDEFIDSGKADLTDQTVWFSAAESLARFHAAFWNLRNIDPAKLPPIEEDAVLNNINQSKDGFAKFRAYVGDRFDNGTYAMFEHAVQINCALQREAHQRRLQHENITIVHGDSHIYNFMVSPTQSVPPALIDFQFWGIGLGAGDLAHLTRVSFLEAFCRTLHKPLVGRYYETLTAQGVHGYSWEQCWNDYRRQVADMLLIPVWQYVFFDLQYDNWRQDVQKLVLNYRALKCDEIEA
jgi:hypothetical protein